MKMQKIIITLACLASLLLTAGCSSTDKSRNMPTSSWLERIPIVYRQDIQQGNIITQEKVDQLKPGMSKRQVRYLLGTPMLVDVFHQNRWDYVYTMTKGWGDMEEKRMALFFQNDALTQIDGDYKPDPSAPTERVAKQDVIVSVPDYVDPDRGIVTKAIETVEEAFDDDDEDSPGANAPAPDSMQFPPAVPSEQPM